VFAGHAGEAPTNLYGETKYAGEQAVLETYKDVGKDSGAVVLRVPMLYGEAETPGESAVNVLMEAVWKAQEKTVEVVEMDHWALRYPTNTEDVARVCKGSWLLCCVL
jgi:S-adenosylmethionine synthetase